MLLHYQINPQLTVGVVLNHLCEIKFSLLLCPNFLHNKLYFWHHSSLGISPLLKVDISATQCAIRYYHIKQMPLSSPRFATWCWGAAWWGRHSRRLLLRSGPRQRRLVKKTNRGPHEMQKRGLLDASRKEFPLLVPAVAWKFSPKIVGAGSAAFHSSVSYKSSTRSSAKESGDGVWEQIKSVWSFFLPLSDGKWEQWEEEREQLQDHSTKTAAAMYGGRLREGRRDCFVSTAQRIERYPGELGRRRSCCLNKGQTFCYRHYWGRQCQKEIFFFNKF